MKKTFLNNFCFEMVIVSACAISIVFLLSQDTLVSRMLNDVCSQDVMAAGPSLVPLAGLRFMPETLEVHSGRL